MKKRIIIIAAIHFILLFSSAEIHAQNNSNNFVPNEFNAYYFTPQNVGFSTPQTAEFTKYGNLNVKHYNGLLDLEIPLCEYEDNDFAIPISLKYVSEGFKPSKRPSLAGYNWILNVGGVITRAVQGSPDDTKGFYIQKDTELKYMPDGYFAAKKRRENNYNNDELWNFQMEKTQDGNPYFFGDFKSDFDPDIFYFNFGKYSGSFVIDASFYNGLVQTKDEYKIDVSNLTIQDYSTTNTPKDSEIKITTPDGCIYTFGGDTRYLEYFIPNNPDKVKKRPVSIISWYLKSIVAPNNKTVTFSYTSTEQKNKYNYFAYNSVSSTVFISPMASSNLCGNSYSYTGPSVYDTATVRINDRVFAPLIDKIEIDKTVIEFVRDKFNKSFYSTETINDLYYLKSIALKYNGQSIKNTVFSYKTQGKYFFLDTLTLNSPDVNKQIYKFDYNLDITLPDPQTISADHWGFWNGGYATEAKITDYFSNIDNIKAVNTSVFNTGLLKKITYPTGGTTEITYEYNRYRNYKTRDSQKIHLQNNTSTTDIPCGGARVSIIKDYDPISGTISNERTFLYKKPNASYENGVIALLPKYMSSDNIQTRDMFSETKWNGGISTTCYYTKMVSSNYFVSSSNSLGNENNLSEYHIGYPDVIEKFKDGSYIYYTFSSLIDVPDDESVNTKYQEPPVAPAIIQARTLVAAQLLEKFGLYKVNDMSKFRGKLLNKTIYSSTNQALEKEIYNYNFEEAKNEYKVSVTSLPAGQVANKIFTVPCRLTLHESIKSNVSNKRDYKYNNANFISEESYSNSKGEEFLKKIIYFTDYDYSGRTNSSDKALIQSMIGKNMIGYLSEEQILVKKNGNWNLLSGRLIKYGQFGNNNEVFKPKEEYILETNVPLTNFIQSELLVDDLIFDSHYKKRIDYNSYDIHANPAFITKDGEEKTVYLWSYSGKYPIAEIKNATYTEVKAALNYNDAQVDALTKQDSPNVADIDAKLRTYFINKTALVTTYTYKPLVGILTAKDPRGVVTTYEYDAFGRLKSTSLDGKIVEGYDYNYKQ